MRHVCEREMEGGWMWRQMGRDRGVGRQWRGCVWESELLLAPLHGAAPTAAVVGPLHGRLAEFQTRPSTGATLLHVIVVYIVMH